MQIIEVEEKIKLTENNLAKITIKCEKISFEKVMNPSDPLLY